MSESLTPTAAGFGCLFAGSSDSGSGSHFLFVALPTADIRGFGCGSSVPLAVRLA